MSPSASLTATVHLLTKFPLLCAILRHDHVLGLIDPLCALRIELGGYVTFLSGTLVE